MTVDLLALSAAATLFIGPFLALAIAALAFGADSRPSIDDRDTRGWMVSG